MMPITSLVSKPRHQRVSAWKLTLVGLFLPLVITGIVRFASVAFEGFEGLGFIIVFGPVILAIYILLLTLGWLKMRFSVVLLGLIVFVALMILVTAILRNSGTILEDDMANIFINISRFISSWITLTAAFVASFWVSDFVYSVMLQKTADRSRAALWMFVLCGVVISMLVISYRIVSDVNEARWRQDYGRMWRQTEEAFLQSSEPIFAPLSFPGETLVVTTDPDWRDAYITSIESGHYLKTASMYQFSDTSRVYKKKEYNGRIGNFWSSYDMAKNCRPLQGDIEKCDDNLYARRMVQSGTVITVMLEANHGWPYEELVEVPDKREVFSMNILNALESVPTKEVVTYPRYMDGFRLR